MPRLSPDARREAIVSAALAVALREGLGATTVRDVAAVMGTSSGLVHHYFGSMDEVLAAAFERAATADLERTAHHVGSASGARAALAAFLSTYAPADEDWAFQLWLDAWSEATRRPALQTTSRRLNLAWQAMLARIIREGVADRSFQCGDPDGAAWRVLSLLDGLALQVVAHGTMLDRSQVLDWVRRAAEAELELRPGELDEPTVGEVSRGPRPSRQRSPRGRARPSHPTRSG